METAPVINLPLSSIVVNDDENVRKKYTDIEPLAESIVRDGQLTPILVREIESDPGKYEIVAGFRRHRAMKKAKLGSIQAKIMGLEDEIDRKWVNMLENLHRVNLSDFEKAKGFATLQHDHAMTPEQIAERYGSRGHDEGEGKRKTGMSPSHIRNLTNAYRQLSDKALKAWEKGDMTLQAVFAVKSYTHEQQDEVLGSIKHTSGAHLKDVLRQYEARTNQQGEPTDPVGEEDKKPRKTRPGREEIYRATVWAQKIASGDPQSIAILKWAAGERKTLKIGNKTFNSKTPMAELLGEE